MRVTLQPHRASSAPALRLEAEAERAESGALRLHYRVTGEVGALLLPEPAPPAQADGLWNHTCFEAFLRAPGEAGYAEFNFAPSGQWAAYGFAEYRSGRANLNEMPPPEMESRVADSLYELAASVDLSQAGIGHLPWQIGLTAVIETRDGHKTYWSVAHGPGQPDFHHPDCFALELPPPKGA